MAIRRQDGFTLVELLLAVTIIILLVSILTPTVGRAIELSRRATCAMNVREIARLARVYALTDNLHRGGPPRSLPDVNPTTNNWPTGNRACLWLLVQQGYASPELFICPSLEGFSAAKTAAGGFDEYTFGYSFISMVEQQRSLDNSYGSMVIVADLNPRFRPVSSTIYEYADLDQSGGTDAAEQKRADELAKDGKLGNSAAHGYDGQNAAMLDERTDFLRRPIVRTGSNDADNIYESINPGSDQDGKARQADDVLLLN